MSKLQKFGYGVALLFAFAAGAVAASDNVLSARYIRLMNGGALSWIMRVASNGQVQFFDNVNGRTALMLNDNTGSVAIRSVTAAQADALTPTQVGEILFLNTAGGQKLIYSTGTAQGQWSTYGHAGRFVSST